MAEPGSFERRAFVALAVAAVAGLAAAFVAAAAVDREPYDDGIELFVPTTAAAAATGVVVLLGFAVMEGRRGNRARLSAAARGLAGLCLVGGTLAWPRWVRRCGSPSRIRRSPPRCAWPSRWPCGSPNATATPLPT